MARGNHSVQRKPCPRAMSYATKCTWTTQRSTQAPVLRSQQLPFEIWNNLKLAITMNSSWTDRIHPPYKPCPALSILTATKNLVFVHNYRDIQLAKPMLLKSVNDWLARYNTVQWQLSSPVNHHLKIVVGHLMVASTSSHIPGNQGD